VRRAVGSAPLYGVAARFFPQPLVRSPVPVAITPTLIPRNPRFFLLGSDAAEREGFEILSDATG
jgi:hypothetical protein